jgi:hypothetical protein
LVREHYGFSKSGANVPECTFNEYRTDQEQHQTLMLTTIELRAEAEVRDKVIEQQTLEIATLREDRQRMEDNFDEKMEAFKLTVMSMLKPVNVVRKKKWTNQSQMISKNVHKRVAIVSHMTHSEMADPRNSVLRVDVSRKQLQNSNSFQMNSQRKDYLLYITLQFQRCRSATNNHPENANF